MKSIVKFLFIVLVITLLSCFLAPVLYTFLPYKFERIFNRLIMIFTLLAVAVAVYRGALSFPKETILWQRKKSLSLFSFTFIAGFLILFTLMLLKGLVGIFELNIAEKTLAAWGERLVVAFAAALLIGVIEECFFRGFFFTTLRKKFAWPLGASVIVTNFFYSIIHFVDAQKPFIGPEPGFSDSLKLVAAPFLSLLEWQAFWPGAVGLFVFGCVLTFLYLRTGSLYPCIGLHAGCVFFLKMHGAFGYYGTTEQPFFWGTSEGYDGVLGWVFLAVLGWLIVKGAVRWKYAAVPILIAWVTVCAPSREVFAEQTWTSDASPLSASEEEQGTRLSETLGEAEEPAVLEAVDSMAEESHEDLPYRDAAFLPGHEDEQDFRVARHEEMGAKAVEIAVDTGQGFLLSRDLRQGNVSLLRQGTATHWGGWLDDGFVVQLEDQDIFISRAREMIAGELREGVLVDIPPERTLRVHLRDVPPERALKIRYGFPDSEVSGDPFNAVFIRLYAGRHFLKRFRVLNEKGWHQETLSLGPAGFLNQPIRLTLDFSSAHSELRRFLLEIEA